MNKKHFSLSRRELSGGLVNRTVHFRVSAGEHTTNVVWQSSPRISEELVPVVAGDKIQAEHVGIRQIHIDPHKYERAQTISDFLDSQHVPHTRVLRTKTDEQKGSMITRFVEGIPGSELARSKPEFVWQHVGSFLAKLHQLPLTDLAQRLGVPLEQLSTDEWLSKRFEFLLSRLRSAQVEVDGATALRASTKILSDLPKIVSPISLTHDDPKPDALLFPHVNQDPSIVDLESLTIGHRIIDGIGRGFYWGPIGIPLSKGEASTPQFRNHVLINYNNSLPASWRISESTMDQWCIASELFWLPDVVGVHSLVPTTTARNQGIQRRINKFNQLITAIDAENMQKARELILFS